MKAFIFDPLWDELVTAEARDRLMAAGLELFVTKEIAPLMASRELFSGDEERLLCINPDYVDWRLNSDDYRDIPSLRGILGAATSYSWIDMAYANEKGIAVCNIRDFSTDAVAEWAIMMMLNLARRTPMLIRDGFPLDFKDDFMRYRGERLAGKTVGVVGLGHIGEAIARRCEGLGMNVIYWSRTPKQTHYTYEEIDELFAKSDVVFPAMSINDQSKDIITPNLLNTLRPSCMLVSVVHGLFDEQHAINMVASGRLYGFGFEAEPNSFNDYTGNVWAAPAYAWTTRSSMENAMQKWIENMIFAARGVYPNQINNT